MPYFPPPPVSGSVVITDISVAVPYDSLLYKATIIDASVIPSTKIITDWGQFLPTDENFADPDISFHTVSGTGSFDLFLVADSNNKFGGIFKFHYLKG